MFLEVFDNFLLRMVILKVEQRQQIAMGMWKRKLQLLKWKPKVKQLNVLRLGETNNLAILHALTHEHVCPTAEILINLLNQGRYNWKTVNTGYTFMKQKIKIIGATTQCVSCSSVQGFRILQERLKIWKYMETEMLHVFTHFAFY